MGLATKRLRRGSPVLTTGAPPPVPVNVISVTFVSTFLARWKWDGSVSAVIPGAAEPNLEVTTVQAGLLGAAAVIQGPTAAEIDATYSLPLTVGLSFLLGASPTNLSAAGGFTVPQSGSVAGPAAEVISVTRLDAQHANWLWNQDLVIILPNPTNPTIQVQRNDLAFARPTAHTRLSPALLRCTYVSVHVLPCNWQNNAQPNSISNPIAFPRSGSLI